VREKLSKMLDFLPVLITLCGAFLLAISLRPAWRLIHYHPASTVRWWALLFLIIGFVLGYLYYCLLVYGWPLSLYSMLVSLVFLGGGAFVFIVTSLSEKTLQKFQSVRLAHGLALSTQERLSTILNNTAEGIITFDEKGLIENANVAVERLFGYTEEEVRGRDILLFVLPTDSRDRREGYLDHFMRSEIQKLLGHEGELLGRHKDGTTFPLAIKVRSMKLDGRQVYTALLSDITERKELVSHLQYMAERDGLTGLFNRSYFQAELDRLVERVCRSQQQCCALLYMDLDNFKYVNDTLGHAAGDYMLIEVAGLLGKRARKSDLIARIGGDEFSVMLYNATAQLAVSVAESFREQIAGHSFLFKGQRVDIGCSIGVAMLTCNTRTASEALSHADLACHLSKRDGKNRVHLFNPDEDQSSVTTMSLDIGWSGRIKDAIASGNFVLACQPIVNTRTREVESYEVLIRMLDENNEMIMPGGFLPSAERFGLAVDIDRWVIKNAIETLAIQRSEKPGLRYAINLSGQTLSQTSVCDLIFDTLHATGLDPAALTFEVTETVAIADMSQAESFLSRLRQLGCRTALDDFGSGFSSFAYLKDLPVDEVKLDGRFVRNIANSHVDQAMVRAMNDIAHALGKLTVAEFVETEEALDVLARLGVDYVQGYHLGRPDYVLPCKAIAEHAGAIGMCRI
jgi:diguanylate cyclase (GGDEF)-like protein/PAS domain S-box-containing protein